MVNESYAGRWCDLRLDEILARMSHDAAGDCPAVPSC
jgi:hypothetical protein